jgi:beta-glucosidase
MDLPNLSLPNGQDKLIATVAGANPNTIVVLETGAAVTMPWVNQVAGIVEAWYAGSKGADAVANVLFGQVNPSAKLPITFPVSEADLPHPVMTVPTPDVIQAEKANKPGPLFNVDYDEGLKVGYKWYDAEKKAVLFPFGFGLSYTTYSYSGLSVQSGAFPAVSFKVTNTGPRAGNEVAQVYAALPPAAGEPFNRLVAWTRVSLEPGETKQVSLAISRKYLSIFEESAGRWKLVPGIYTFRAGSSSRDLPLAASTPLE